jgi:GNAT superfamily N-acetyltransferase
VTRKFVHGHLRPAEGDADLDEVRRLLTAYGRYLASNPAGAANICLQDYDRELQSLPGPFAPPSGALLLARVDGQAAGTCALKPVPSGSGEPALEMKRLWVEPQFRGFGLGRRLIQASIDFALAAGCSALYLDTVPVAMPEANHLYRAMGFEVVDRYNDNPLPGVVFFRKSLQKNALP